MNDTPSAYNGPTRVFSGVQPTGNLHLGNYLGAIKNFVKMQDTHAGLYCIVDMHAITVFQDPKELKASIREVTALFMASGLDPKKSILFNQSKVSAHAELAWILNCVARMGWLNRMTQFKEKAGKHKENASVGLFAYPVLMAADILAYRATHVPVGDDQKQHLELARDIAQKFNNDYGALKQGCENFFPLPDPLIQGPGARIMSLRDGSKKMSKSETSDMTRINMTDDADTIAQKIRKARTDPDPLPSEVGGLEGRAEARNLVGIYAALSDTTAEEVLNEMGGLQFSEFKPKLVDLTLSVLEPINHRFVELMNNAEEIDLILADGAGRAAEIADPILAEVKELVGFV
ncbi:MAG: tryptophan--tRNA ligase [Alphaproteobacteria bacterium]|nr:MAG: tryptophan--tRNA ligase [Alphaproteobacteria bacterium]